MRVASGVTRRERERELKYSGRKGSDKFQRRVSSPQVVEISFQKSREIFGWNTGVYGGLIMGERDW